MNSIKRFSVFLTIGLLLGICPSYGSAQLFSNAKMTDAFRSMLNEMAAKNGGAFVSACRGPGKADRAILLIGIGSNLANLSLWTSGQVYNGAGFEIKGGRMNFIEGGGGAWSMQKLQFYARVLASSAFELKFAAQLHLLPASWPHRVCPEFKEKLTYPSS